jgi:Ca-activated chloride channel family protein
MTLRLGAPWFLALLPFALAAAVWMARRRARTDARLALPEAAVRRGLGSSPWTRLDRGMPWIRGLVLVLLVVGLARPQAGERIESVSTFGVDIVVALDVSGSMRAEDFRPKNRLEVARRTIADFVRGRPDDRIGLVSFAATATTRCPLTQDHEMLETFLDALDFAPPDLDGTAIGLGLATAVNRLRQSSAKSRVVVLATDGVNNRGQIGPRAAAEAARALGIRVYAIGVGSEGEAWIPVDLGPRGWQKVRQQVEIDEDLLREIAGATGGRYFRATDAEGLGEVFRTIDGLEKTEIESRIRVLFRELFPWVVTPALGLLLLERVLSATRLRRLP